MGLLLRGQKSRADSHLACWNAPAGVLNLWASSLTARGHPAVRNPETSSQRVCRQEALRLWGKATSERDSWPAHSPSSTLPLQLQPASHCYCIKDAKPDPLSPTLPKFLTHRKQERIIMVLNINFGEIRSAAEESKNTV